MRKTKNNYVPAEFGGYLFTKSCLPDILPGDRGKVLTVNEGETGAKWAEASGDALIVHGTWTSGICTLDKTAREIRTAFRAGKYILFDLQDETATLIGVTRANGAYSFLVFNVVSVSGLTFYAVSLDDYPTTE